MVANSLAFINGNIFTVNPSSPRASAFIVNNGIFTHISTDSEITTLARQHHIPIHNLQNRFIMPGIHDAHCHMLFSALSLLSHTRLPMDITNETLASTLKTNSCACQFSHVHQDWLLAGTYLIPDFDRKHLDTEYPDTPVMIRGGAGHSIFLNTEALTRAGYDIDNEPDGQGTAFLRDTDGKLTGEMAEMSMSKAILALPKAPQSHAKRAMKHAQKLLHTAGVTSVQEASANTAFLEAAKEMESECDLKLELFPHIVYAPDWIGEETSESLHKLLDEADKYKSKHIDTRFVKIILDGVPLAPYFSHAGMSDGKVDDRKLFIRNVEEVVKKYDQRGMTMKIHCTGDGATRLTLDAYEAARKENPDGPKHEVAHCSGVSDEDYARFKALNITAEMSPAFFFVHPVTEASEGLMDWNFGKMLKANAEMTIGSDWGAGESPDILPCLSGIVETVGEGDRRLGGERICRMLTLGGAEAVGREKDLGSIEVGKKANFIALDKDLSLGEFDGVKVLKTWFEGEVVYNRE